MNNHSRVFVSHFFLAAAIALILTLPRAATSAGEDLPLEMIKLPPGFKISIYARIAGARSMTLGEQGALFVGTRPEGRVYAVLDHKKAGKADEVITVADGLNTPNGVAFKDGALYVAENNRIIRYEGIESRLRNPPRPEVVTDSLPSRTHHGWRYLRAGPDGKLYISIGAPCNICDEPGFAAIKRLNTDGTGMEVFASGVRNSIGFDWHPQTKDMWFTDNGRDWLGADMPPDELNHAPRQGMHFGYPYCHGNDILDPEYGKGRTCAGYTPPAMALGPHVASLGMRFYSGDMFPGMYRNQIFIAEHGSWNRSKKIGYRISLVYLEGNRTLKYEPFAEGWLQGESAWGRPVDVQVMPDGALLVSDDKAGVIYRITYGSR